ncbi:hypothetical protein L3X38_031335 [Prunus dulcis]|uniref:RNase H type-1 domain-containing protein n=1 Tax=Prunus dulcis TaxID=3755 RepID=A0AAD4VCA7_PRUDU|nr:hypothetical protein L3X38_031335 [Prunus dulcis]
MSLVKDWVSHCFRSLTPADPGFFFMMGWSLWEQRNGLLWNNKSSCPSLVGRFAHNKLLEYLQVNRPGGTPYSNQDQVQRWTKPPMRHLKINVDGRAWKFDNIFSALQSEASAREGVVLAVERGSTNICFESDSLQIVTALGCSSLDRSFIGPILEDSKFLLLQIIGEGFAHVDRTVNEAAHCTARFALHLGTPIS